MLHRCTKVLGGGVVFLISTTLVLLPTFATPNVKDVALIS